MKYTDSKSIVQAVNQGNAHLSSDLSYSEEFWQYHSKLELKTPLLQGIDWSKYQNASFIDWSGLHDSVILSWSRSLAIGRHEHIMIFFNKSEPCLLMPFDWGIANFDQMIWGAPGHRYMFGADITSSGWEPHFAHLIEFDGICGLTGFK